MLKLKVIEGGKASLEEKILKDMFRGAVKSEDIDRLRPCGNLRLVSSQKEPIEINVGASRRAFSMPVDWLGDRSV